MKRTIIALTAILISSTGLIRSFDFKSILSGSSSNGDSSVTGILDAVSSLVGGGEMSYTDMVGSWSYSSPAVTFTSENLLQKAGGTAASATIEEKLLPYYQRAGVTDLKIEFLSDSTFTATAGKFKSQGTVSELQKGSFTFQFKAFGQIPSGSVNAYVQKNATGMVLTFDATKLMQLVSKIASVSNNATLKGVSSLLDSYQGMNIGVKLKKTSD